MFSDMQTAAQDGQRECLDVLARELESKFGHIPKHDLRSHLHVARAAVGADGDWRPALVKLPRISLHLHTRHPDYLYRSFFTPRGTWNGEWVPMQAFDDVPIYIDDVIRLRRFCAAGGMPVLIARRRMIRDRMKARLHVVLSESLGDYFVLGAP